VVPHPTWISIFAALFLAGFVWWLMNRSDRPGKDAEESD